MRRWRTIDGDDVYRQQETAAAAAADDNWKYGGCGRETTVTRDSNERRPRQRIGDDDCGGLRQLPWTAMATDDDGVERRRTRLRAADDDGEETRPSGEQRRHLAFISGSNS